MKRPVSNLPFRRPPRASQAGSTLLASMSIVLVLAMIAATVLSSISSRYNSAYRSASWNEALLTAEGGLDVTLAEVFRLIPNVTLTSTQGLGTGYSQPSLGLLNSLSISPTGLLSNGTLVNITPPALVHAGEGGTTQQATVSLDVVPLSTLLNNGVPGLLNSVTGLLNGNDLQLLRIRSTGTVYLTGSRVAGISRLDNDLWRPSIFRDRLTGSAISQPTISRQVQVLLRPVFPFESAVVSNGSFHGGTTSIFDSFNSSQTTSSTNGLYDSLKRLSHGAVRVNAASVTIKGTVYGDVDTNGSALAKDSHISGSVNNSAYTPLPLVNAPTWSNALLAPSAITGNTSLAAGTALLPLQYRFTSISGNLHVTKGLLGLGTNVQIYVTGDITGGIEIDSGITAQLYVAGSISTRASKLQNDNNIAANLQIYGVADSSNNSPQIQIDMDADLIASIYAPLHDVTLSGNNDFSGSIAANGFKATGGVRVHYDESLAASVGPLLRYQIASWQEITN